MEKKSSQRLTVTLPNDVYEKLEALSKVDGVKTASRLRQMAYSYVYKNDLALTQLTTTLEQAQVVTPQEPVGDISTTKQVSDYNQDKNILNNINIGNLNSDDIELY